jgi:hypothetical protein
MNNMENIITFLLSYDKEKYSVKSQDNEDILELSFDDFLKRINDEVEVSRIKSYQHFFDYYDGNIVKYRDSIDGERPYSNISNNFVTKLNGWLLQEPPIIRSKNVLSSIINELIEELFENTDKSFISSCLINASVYGDCFSKVCMVLEDFMKDFTYSFKFKLIKHPKYCFPFYDPNNNLVSIIVVYPDFENDSIEKSSSLYFEVWTNKIVYCSYKYLLDENEFFVRYSEGRIKDFDIVLKGELIENKKSPFYNLYAFDNIYGEIPFVHFKNLNFFNLTYGVSDLRAISIFAREKTSLINDLKDIIDYQSNPALVVKGAKYNDLDVNKAGKVYSNLPKDSELDYLSLKIGDLDKIIEKYESMINNEISSCGLPYDFLISSREFISGDSSASALKLRFSSVLVFLVLKKIFLEEGFENLIEKGLRFLNNFNKLQLDEVRFPDSYTARRVVNINEAIQEEIFNIYLESIKDDEIVKSVIDELESFGFQVKSKDVLEILTDLSDEYKKKYEEAVSYIEKLSFNTDQINKFIKIRSLPYYKVEFSFKNYLPHSRRQILDDLEVELRNNIESISGALERLGYKTPDKKIDEILRDSEIIGLIKGTADKSQQLQLLDVQKIRENMQLLSQLEANAIEQLNSDTGDIQEDQNNNEVGMEDIESSDNIITDRVTDSKGGRGRKKVLENPQKVEDQTGQSAESIISKRKFKSQN